MKRFSILFVSLVATTAFNVAVVSAQENEKHDLKQTVTALADLFKYYGNAFIWQKKILKRGQVCSELVQQAPVKKFDGTIGKNKAVQVCRGYVDKDGTFNKNNSGNFVKVDLYSDGMYDAGSIMMLVSEGAGAAASCWKDIVGMTVPKYNCFFRTQPTSDGGVLMRWTMYHPGEMKEIKTLDPIKAIMHGATTDLTIRPEGLMLMNGATFEVE